jgi:hypothetical protein
MGQFTIAAYRPRPGKAGELMDSCASTTACLRGAGLVTDRRPYVMRAADGTLVEVFEWIERGASDRAHSVPAVQALWARFNEACEYVSLSALAEAQSLFASFEAVEP